MTNWEWFTKEDLNYINSWYMTEWDIYFAKIENLAYIKKNNIMKSQNILKSK